MKKINLNIKFKLSLFLLLLSHVLFAQVDIVVHAPLNASATTAVRMPSGTSAQTTLRGHFIIPASELSHIASGTLIKGIGTVLTNGTNTPAGGNIKFYLQNTADHTNTKSTTWSTAISSMLAVYDGDWQLPIGTRQGVIDVTLPQPFVYGGGGIYVAYDYLGSTFSTGAATYVANNDLAGSLYMNQSSTTTPPATVTTATAFRPQMRFKIANPNKNDIGLSNIKVPLGYFSNWWQDSNTVSVLVSNTGWDDAVSIPVTITGANGFSVTKTIPQLEKGDTTTVVFDVQSSVSGKQTFSVSVPNDEVNSNNVVEISQLISCSDLGYSAYEPAYDGIGFNTSAGIVAVKYTAPAIPILIDGVYVDISDASANIGKPLTGVLLNSSGQIVASSVPITLKAEDLGNRLYFPLENTVTLAPGTVFYLGAKQEASSGFYPVATAAPKYTVADRYYSFPVSGGTSINYTDLGHLKIGAAIRTHVEWERVTLGEVLEGDAVEFSAIPGFSKYKLYVNGVLRQTFTTPTFSYIPQDADVVSLEVENNGCSLRTHVEFTMEVKAPIALPTTLYSLQSFAGDEATLADLQIQGTAIKWYASVAGSDQLPVTTRLVSGTAYYASQTLQGVESARTKIQVHRISDSKQAFCGDQSPTIADLRATPTQGGQVNWFAQAAGGAALQASDAITSGTYYVQNYVSGLPLIESNRVPVEVIVESPVAPTVTTPIRYTYGDAAIALTATATTGNDLLWYTSAVGGTGSSTAPVPLTHAIGTQSFWVSQITTYGCESPRSKIDVTVYPKPILIKADIGQNKVFGATDPVFSFTPSVSLIGTDAFTGNLSREAGEDVGVYKITQGNLSAGVNYILTFEDADFEITKAVIPGITMNGASFPYDGKSKSLSVQGTLPSGTEVTYTGNGKTNAGTYPIIARIKGGNNYEDLTLEAELTITKIAATITAEAVQNHLFNGSVKNVVASINHPETDLIFSPQQGYADAGTYPVVISAKESTNYLATSKEVSLIIGQADFAGLNFPNKTVIYDRKDQSIVLTGTPAGAQVVYTIRGSNGVGQSEVGNSKTDAGTYILTATVTHPNYVSKTLTATLTINKAQQQIQFDQIGTLTRDANRVPLKVSANSGLPITVKSDDQLVATVDGGDLLIHRLGTVRLTATQEGNHNYEAAAPVSITVLVADEAEGPIRVHPALSPNGDGVNDFLILEGVKDYPENTLQIVTRTGVVVFEMDGYDNNSRVFRGVGNVNRAGKILPEGTYFYILEFKENGKLKVKKGWFVLKM